VNVEGEAGAENVGSQQPEFAGLIQREGQVLDGQRILGADVDDSLRGPGGVGADQHSLDDAVRVSFQDAAVHVRARIAFVGVTDDDLAAAAWLPGEHFPFHSGGEAASAAPAKSRLLDLL